MMIDGHDYPGLAPTRGVEREATIVEQFEAAKGIMRMTLDCPPLARGLDAGQFLSVTVPGEGRQLTRIPLSFVATEPGKGLVHLVYAVLGAGTRRLAELPVGRELTVFGPLGHGWHFGEGLERVLLVSGGTGTVPVYAAAVWCHRNGVTFDAVVGARSKELHWAVEQLRERTEGDVVVATDDGSLGERGLASEPALRLLDERDYDLVLVCGPEPLMEAVSARAIERDVPCEVSMERTMACGFGACSTCATKTTSGMKGACMAGPVFDAREVIW